MSLIDCPECKAQVSSTAEACPHCGAPIAGAKEGRAAGAPLTTVQETSKKLKLQIIFSAIIFWVGAIWLFAESNAAKDNATLEPSVTPPLLILVGLMWYLITRFRIWWHHR